MTRIAPSHEQHESQLIDLTRQKSAGLLAAIRAKQPQATKLLLDCLGDYLSDNNALAQLVRESLVGTNSLQGVITDLIWTEAEQMAKRELFELSLHNRELSTGDRIARHLDAQLA